MSTQSDLLYLKGVIFDMNSEDRAKVEEFKAKFDQLVDEGGDAALIALTWAGLEFAAD